MVKRRRNHKWIYRIIFLVLLVCAGIICYLVWDNYFNDKKDDNSDVSYEQTVVQEEKEEDKIEQETKEDKKEEDEKKTVQYEGDDPNTKDELSGTVTYAGKVDNRVTIRVNIDQYLSEGKCELGLVKNGAMKYSETANIASAASTATCEGFDVSASNLESGKYDIIINISSGAKKGVIKGEVDV